MDIMLEAQIGNSSGYSMITYNYTENLASWGVIQFQGWHTYHLPGTALNNIRLTVTGYSADYGCSGFGLNIHAYTDNSMITGSTSCSFDSSGNFTAVINMSPSLTVVQNVRPYLGIIIQ
jgi:hypothetical protein